MGELFLKHEELPQHKQDENKANTRGIEDPKPIDSDPKLVQKVEIPKSVPASKDRGVKRNRYVVITSLD